MFNVKTSVCLCVLCGEPFLYKKQLKTPIHLGAKEENICSFAPPASPYTRISLKNYRFSINFSRKPLVV